MPDPSRRSGGAVLVVEDDAEVRSLLTDALVGLGYGVGAVASAEEALVAVELAPPDLVLTDVNMGAMSGVELCARLKADPRFALTPVVILTAVHDLEARVAGLAAGADDFFAKPFELLELRTRLSALLRVKTLLDLLERAQSVITALGATIEARDVYTRGAVPDGVLLKNGPLTPAERQQINLHPGVGADLVRGMHTLDEVRPIIRHHHERWDGSGYPDGLRGEAIPLGARVMAVVDVYDALRTARPYKPPLSLAETLDILKAETDAGAWDPRIVVCLPDVLRELGVTDEPDARMPGGISHGA
jgi:putative two-component system response regulator